jgi:hypothetical protein
MASKKKKAAKAGAGAIGAAQAARNNPYVQRVVEDDELRDNLRTAYGKGPAKALLDDKKTQKELKEAASSLKEAADALRGGKKKKSGGIGKKLLLLVVGAGVALALSEGLRKKVLDTLFGAEEEFEYTSTTTPSSTGTPVGTS